MSLANSGNIFNVFLGPKPSIPGKLSEASPEYMAAKQDAESRYNDGEDIETIIADYPQFKRELYNDVIGGFEGMDY